MLQLRLGRCDALQKISTTVYNANDRAHKECLQKIGLGVGPCSAKERGEYVDKVFWPSIKKIAEDAYLELHSRGDLKVENPAVVVLNFLFANLPIKHKRIFLPIYIDAPFAHMINLCLNQ